MPTNPISTGPFVWDGSASAPEEILVTTRADVAGDLGGKYWNLNHPSGEFYVWYDTGNKETREVQFVASDPSTYYSSDNSFTLQASQSGSGNKYSIYYPWTSGYNSPPVYGTNVGVNSSPLYYFSPNWPELAATGPVGTNKEISVVASSSFLSGSNRFDLLSGKVREDGSYVFSREFVDILGFTRLWSILEYRNNFFWLFGYTANSVNNTRVYRSDDGVNFSFFAEMDNTSGVLPGQTFACVFSPAAMEYANGIYVVGGNGPYLNSPIYYSTDASTWNISNLPIATASTILDFATDGTTFVALGPTNKIFTSTDGNNWTQQTTPPGMVQNIERIVYAPTFNSNNGLFIILSRYEALTSEDGITWTRTVLPAPPVIAAQIFAIEYGSATFTVSPFFRDMVVAAVRNNTSVGADMILYTDDGVSWSWTQPWAGDTDVRGITFQPYSGMFLMVGRTSIASDYDGGWHMPIPPTGAPSPVQFTKDTSITVEELNKFTQEAIEQIEADDEGWTGGEFTTSYSGAGALTIENVDFGIAEDSTYLSISGILSLTNTIQGDVESTDPAPPGKFGAIKVPIQLDWTDQLVALKTADRVNAAPYFFANYVATNQVEVVNSIDGNVTDSTDGDAGFSVVVTSQGSNLGSGIPPANINRGDYLESAKINEIKNNADFLLDNTESCFNEKINEFVNRETLRRTVRYEDQYALRRDTVNTQLNATNRDADLGTVWSTANTGRRDVAYTTRRDVANRTRCDVAGRFRTRARSNDWSGANNSYWSGVGAGCTGHHTTYHSGVDTTDRGIRDASEYLTFNSANDGDDHSARHNIFCSILT